MLKRTLCSLLLLSAALTRPVVGQTKESLLIGPGDLLHVSVFDNPELEQHVRVTDAGDITLLMGGTVSVSNKTPAETAKVVETALLQGHILIKPKVSVTVDQYETQSVTVIGEVKDPSFYRINTPTSIIEVLAMAGGVSDSADRRMLIERRGTHEKISYFLSNDAAVAAQTAVSVNPGDIVIVPKAGIVYILGDVSRPGGYTISDNEAKLSVLELVARAGGTNHSAVPSQAKLIHKTEQGYETTPLPLSDIQKGKRPDLQLQANDVIYVPFSYLRNIAMQGAGIAGSVATASIYRF
jgi:polysaccharide export outer membrane protein